jgi:hypothetical protein
MKDISFKTLAERLTRTEKWNKYHEKRLNKRSKYIHNGQWCYAGRGHLCEFMWFDNKRNQRCSNDNSLYYVRCHYAQVNEYMSNLVRINDR